MISNINIRNFPVLSEKVFCILKSKLLNKNATPLALDVNETSPGSLL